jgi:hypothetical protein
VCFGGDLPAVIWREAAAALLRGVKPKPFPEPGEDERVFPERRRLQPSYGLSPGEDTSDEDDAEIPEEPTEATPGREPEDEVSPTPSPEPDESPPPDEEDDDDGGILPLPPPG